MDLNRVPNAQPPRRVATFLFASVAVVVFASLPTAAQPGPINPGPRQLPPVRQAPRTPGSPARPAPRIAPQPAARDDASAAHIAPREDLPLPPSGLRGKIGQNISGLSDYDRQMVYINAAKTMRPFGSVEKPWDPSTAPPLSPDGWPTSDFGVTMFTEGTLHWNGVYHFSAKGKVQRLETYSSPCRVVPGSFAYDQATGLTHADIECVARPGQTAQMHLRFIGTEGGL